MVPDEDRGVGCPGSVALAREAPRRAIKEGQAPGTLSLAHTRTRTRFPSSLSVGIPMSTCTTSPPVGEMGWPSTPLCINTGEKKGSACLSELLGWWVTDPGACTHVDGAMRWSNGAPQQL